MDYILKKSSLIRYNQREFIREIEKAHSLHQKLFDGESSTWTYGKYNVFALTSPSPLFYDLLQELKTLINGYVLDPKKWMQSWINFHTPSEVLDWHNHSWPYHGYICIDPKHTTTQFRGYSIPNEVGNIYLGPGNREHRVVVDQEFDSPRITLGFDIHTSPAPPFGMNSLLPL